MDLRQLRHFVTLARTLNYRQAAEQLHMSVSYTHLTLPTTPYV